MLINVVLVWNKNMHKLNQKEQFKNKGKKKKKKEKKKFPLWLSGNESDLNP